MSDGDNKTPKSLSDVSHLFFSNVEEQEKAADSAPPEAISDGPDVSAPREASRSSGTKVLVVTGGENAPGKSTVAVNVACSLSSRGRVGLIDADPRIPNARFHLGLPSWQYLSPVTGEGQAAPNVFADSDLAVIDFASDASAPSGVRRSDVVLSAEIGGDKFEPLDFAVFDLAVSRAARVRSLVGQRAVFLVVTRPNREGFEETYAALAVLRKVFGVREAGLIVNMSRSDEETAEFHAKTATAAERLLSMKTRLVGRVTLEPGLGGEQRERGPIVRSRPDALSALALRDATSQAIEWWDSTYINVVGRPVSATTENESEGNTRTIVAS